MAKALFTAEQVHEAADAIAAEGKEVTALLLLSRLGGGSLTTIYKHLLSWRQAREQAASPANSQAIPEPVQAAFNTALGRAWSAAAAEAAKEVIAVKEKAAEEVLSANKQFEEALQAIERMEEQSESDTAKIESLTTRVGDLESELQKSEKEKAGLEARTEQLGQQVKSQQAEIERLHKDSEIDRKSREEAVAEAANIRGQLESLKEQHSELLERLTAAKKN